jgi:hypothetical protein
MPNVAILFTNGEIIAVKAFILKTLNDARIKDIVFSETMTENDATVLAGIYPNNHIVDEIGKKFDGLSVATVNGPLPRSVWLNQENFTTPPSHFKDADDYRRYVILHEFMHALGLVHVDTAAGENCAVMTPQTFQPTCTPTHELQQIDRDSLEYRVNIFSAGRRRGRRG